MKKTVLASIALAASLGAAEPVLAQGCCGTPGGSSYQPPTIGPGTQGGAAKGQPAPGGTEGTSGASSAVTKLSAERAKELDAVAGEWVLVKVTGLPCEKCVPVVENALAGVAGVRAVTVNYERGEALVRRDERRCRGSALVQAVLDASAKFDAKLAPLAVKTFKVDGMKCASCVGVLKSSLHKLAAVKDSVVKKGEATVIIDAQDANAEKIAEAISSMSGPSGAKFKATEIEKKRAG